MPSAAALRIQIEESLATRFRRRSRPCRAPSVKRRATGIAAVDALLDGGLPVGAISEVVGPECSGRTTLSLAFVASCTARGQVCAWVDACDALDPESAAASGVHLPLLLWIRLHEQQSGFAHNKKQARTEKLVASRSSAAGLLTCCCKLGGFAALVLDLGRCRSSAGHADSTGYLVSLSSGCGPHALQLAGVGPGFVCAVECGCSAGLLCAPCGSARGKRCSAAVVLS